ncbi:MAG TPA: CDP-glucose 4,6-dehydratase [Rickettsiales bacterium]|nr:CDP-glucose 4,6-dehydratase [Rickettsiales bacterium]
MVKAGFWKHKRVLVTGHTGFKGGWLALWLTQMGADVTGIALAPHTEPNFFETVGLEKRMHHIVADIRDGAELAGLLHKAQPEIVLHLAAQPLVRYSYKAPVETYETNVMGTVNLLEAVRACPGVKATLIITTDKCYENVEQIWGYREHDRLGGHDPYSNSKACAELVVQAYTRSFFVPGGKSGAIASARAGNVIGGGDWSEDRLVPDLVRGLMQGQAPVLRNPSSVRPWQHVLEPLSGYLMLAEMMYGKIQDDPVAYNFGPDTSGQVDVGTLARRFCEVWGGGIEPQIVPDPKAVHEAHLLTLDITKARKQLHWNPVWDMEQTVVETASWYKAYTQNEDMLRFSLDQIERYCAA